MSWVEILCVGWALSSVVCAIGWARAARRLEYFDDDYAGWGRPRRRR